MHSIFKRITSVLLSAVMCAGLCVSGFANTNDDIQEFAEQKTSGTETVYNDVTYEISTGLYNTVRENYDDLSNVDINGYLIEAAIQRAAEVYVSYTYFNDSGVVRTNGLTPISALNELGCSCDGYTEYIAFVDTDSDNYYLYQSEIYGVQSEFTDMGAAIIELDSRGEKQCWIFELASNADNKDDSDAFYINGTYYMPTEVSASRFDISSYFVKGGSPYINQDGTEYYDKLDADGNYMYYITSEGQNIPEYIYCDAGRAYPDWVSADPDYLTVSDSGLITFTEGAEIGHVSYVTTTFYGIEHCFGIINESDAASPDDEALMYVHTTIDTSLRDGQAFIYPAHDIIPADTALAVEYISETYDGVFYGVTYDGVFGWVYAGDTASHDTNPSFTLSDDYVSCDVTFTCPVCGFFEGIVTTDDITPTVHDATCITDGYVTYAISCDFNDVQYTTSIDVITESALGHNYNKPFFEWSADEPRCEAVYICNICGNETRKDCEIESVSYAEPSCTEPGEAVYSASIDNYVVTDADGGYGVYVIPATGHSFADDGVINFYYDDSNPYNASAVFNFVCENCGEEFFIDGDIDIYIEGNNYVYVITAKFNGETYEGTAYIPISEFEHVDRTPLLEWITKAEALKESEYTPESWAELQEALANANAIINSESVTENEIADAVAQLMEAITRLTIKSNEDVDKTALESLLSETEQLDESKYTEESWAILQDAVENARNVLNDMDATQDGIDSATTQLQESFAALIEKTEDSDSTDSDSNDVEENNDTDTDINTDDTDDTEITDNNTNEDETDVDVDNDVDNEIEVVSTIVSENKDSDTDDATDIEDDIDTDTVAIIDNTTDGIDTEIISDDVTDAIVYDNGGKDAGIDTDGGDIQTADLYTIVGIICIPVAIIWIIADRYSAHKKKVDYEEALDELNRKTGVTSSKKKTSGKTTGKTTAKATSTKTATARK